MPPVRRLTAILAADVAGYSRLMGADEEGTHERLQAHLGELVNPKIAEHRGRVVKNTGDGFLAEFASVVDAVRSFRPTFPGFPGLLDEDRPFGRVGQWQIALSAGKRRSKRAVDCAEALKRAASPASRRTFAVGACPI